MKNLYTFVCLFLFLGSAAFAQKGTISGKITTADGNSAVQVTISLKGHHKEVASDNDGSFIIQNVKPGDYTLVVSHIGLRTQEKAVKVIDGETVQVNLTLSENYHQLNEIIIS